MHHRGNKYGVDGFCADYVVKYFNTLLKCSYGTQFFLTNISKLPLTPFFALQNNAH